MLRARWLLASALGPLLALGAVGEARAQNDLDPPLPNVMLLVDTSGSMEYKLDGSAFPTCDPTGSAPSQKSRWIELVEVLTGTIQNYRCQAVNRSTAGFLAEYDINGDAGAGRPYDYQYVNPYHRPLSGECGPSPGVLPANPYAFPDNAVKFRRYDSTTACAFNQATDGILDAYGNQIRFGLMTFDPLTGAETGVSGQVLNYAQGMLGGWSYNWGSTPKANPRYCVTPPLDFDAGARNAAAPPWEGRMVAFGNPASGSTEYRTKRDQIEKILLNTRPFGATPIAGMLHDAREFFLRDASADPLNPALKFGPSQDPYVIDTELQNPNADADAGAQEKIVIRGCREQSIVLLTDGLPNLDLRPFCEPSGTDGALCPFQKPEEIVADLVAGDRPIDTFVIPFALPTFTIGGTTRTCNDLTDADFKETETTSLCGNPANRANEALQACCVLNRIAVAGARPDKVKYYPDEKPRAFFSSNREQLASALSSVLSSTLDVTSRTQPVISGAAAGTTGMRFFTFVQPRPLRPWVGVLRRQRWTCDSDLVPTPAEIDIDKGDDFGANLAAQPSARRFATVLGAGNGQPILSGRSMRPFVSSTVSDGAGTYSGARIVSGQSAFPSAVSPAAMNITNASCPGLTEAACRDRYLKWLVGSPNGTEYSRCARASDCRLLGDVLHSTPNVVGPPNELIRDETYAAFATAQRSRPIVLYASTNDGFLHAFKVGTADPTKTADLVQTRQNNELWAFIPPAVLPDLPKQYPFSHHPLLDGAPVVRDVVATFGTDPTNLSQLRFERVQEDAILGATGKATWRTILIQSFGPMRGGYFAVDVTNPVMADNNDTKSGPRFLWQLTTDEAGNALFGQHGSTPAITTLYFDPSGGANPREVAVAILPGGGATPASGGSGCPSTTSNTFDSLTFSHGVRPRKKVRCYSGADVHARSLTIVRLDTGEIIRTFRKTSQEIANTNLRQRVTATDTLDSPISGQPVAFPAETGAVADRAYVGDQDGRLWRLNLSSTNPAQWRMELFFDAFPAEIASQSRHDFDDGQPIVFPPAVSVDANGDVTLNFATGEQETLGAAPGTVNYVYSLTEKLGASKLSLTRQLNWFQRLENGERVVGPLSLFNSQVFFTTYSPAPNAAPACQNGETRIWGMDYLRPKGYPAINAATLPSNGGDARLRESEESDPEQYLTAAEVTNDPNAVVFGVSVAQQPTCSETSDGSSSNFLKYGEQRQVRNVNPGRFELVMHKGGTNPLNESGDIAQNVATLPLPAPATASRIDSWAALVE